MTLPLKETAGEKKKKKAIFNYLFSASALPSFSFEFKLLCRYKTTVASNIEKPCEIWNQQMQQQKSRAISFSDRADFCWFNSVYVQV